MNAAVDFYLEAQPDALRTTLMAARRLLLSLDDRVREEFKYGVPMYYYHRPFAYLTGVPRQPYAHIGLVQGVNLPDPDGILTGLDKKQVRHLRIATPAEVAHPGVLTLLHEALAFDQARGAVKRRR